MLGRHHQNACVVPGTDEQVAHQRRVAGDVVERPAKAGRALAGVAEAGLGCADAQVHVGRPVVVCDPLAFHGEEVLHLLRLKLRRVLASQSGEALRPGRSVGRDPTGSVPVGAGMGAPVGGGPFLVTEEKGDAVVGPREDQRTPAMPQVFHAAAAQTVDQRDGAVRPGLLNAVDQRLEFPLEPARLVVQALGQEVEVAQMRQASRVMPHFRFEDAAGDDRESSGHAPIVAA